MADKTEEAKPVIVYCTMQQSAVVPAHELLEGLPVIASLR